MKRYFCIAAAFILCLSLCGCAKLNTWLSKRLAPADTVVVFPAQLPEEFSDLDTGMLLAQQGDLQYTITPTRGASAQSAAVAAAAQEPSTAALVVELTSTRYVPALINAASTEDLPLILCGERPPLEMLQDYNNCWYVGFDPLLAAELQAKLITDAYRRDELPEQSGDYKYAELFVGSFAAMSAHADTYRSHAVKTIGLSGIRTVSAAAPVVASDSAALLDRLTGLLLPQEIRLPAKQTQEADNAATAPLFETTAPQTSAEIILCADTAATQAVVAVMDKLNVAANDETIAAFATPVRQYHIAGYGINDAVREMLTEGAILGTVARDTEASTLAVIELCETLARKEAFNKNNDYHFENGKYLMLDYLVFSADMEEQHP